MRPPAVQSAFDVVEWFLDEALNHDEYLQPQKMQNLLFLSQAYYAVAHHGQMLIPSVFVAEDNGPVEPMVYRAYENGKPLVSLRPIPEKVKLFLDSIWRRFGSHSGSYLSRVLMKHPPYLFAYDRGKGSVITLESMIDFYGEGQANSGDGAPSIKQVLRPRVMRSHTGKPVSVQKWIPKRKK